MVDEITELEEEIEAEEPEKALVVVSIHQGKISINQAGEVEVCVINFDSLQCVDDLPDNIDEFTETFPELEELVDLLEEAEANSSEEENRTCLACPMELIGEGKFCSKKCEDDWKFFNREK